MNAEQVELMYGPIIAVVNSRSDPAKMYNVRKRDGVLSCNCKGWVFCKARPRRCKHTDAVGPTSEDVATTICKELLMVIGVIYDGEMLRAMASALRPHLSMGINVSISQPASGLITAGKRLITLDD